MPISKVNLFCRIISKFIFPQVDFFKHAKRNKKKSILCLCKWVNFINNKQLHQKAAKTSYCSNCVYGQTHITMLNQIDRTE